MHPLTAFAGLTLACIIDGPCQNAFAAGKPTTLTVSSVTVTEGQIARPVLSKTGGNGKAVTVKWQTADGRSGSITVGSSPVTLSIPIPDDVIVNGTRGIGIDATVVSGSVHPTGSGVITVLDNDTGPPPPPPPTTKTCPDGTVILTSETCPAPVPAAQLQINGTAKAIQACASYYNPNDTLALGAIYTVVGFAAAVPVGTAPHPSSHDIVILNDATHHGDGWFGIAVAVACVAAQ